MRLIDADALYETLRTDEDIAMEKVFDTPISLPDGALNPSYISFMTQASVLTSFKNMVYDAPTVDAVEVIHCEHCRHHENDSSSDSHWCFVWETFTDNHVYCSFAERREDGNSK